MPRLSKKFNELNLSLFGTVLSMAEYILKQKQRLMQSIYKYILYIDRIKRCFGFKIYSAVDKTVPNNERLSSLHFFDNRGIGRCAS